MKKFLTSLVSLILIISTLCMMPAYARRVEMYALDGRIIMVEEGEVEAYRKVNWYYGKPVTMYALDGRTLIVGEKDVEMYRKVGWYYGKPVTMYASDGRTLTIGENDVDTYRKVGWMLPEDMDCSGDIINLIYHFDYLDVYRNFIKYQGENWAINPPSNNLLPQKFVVGSGNATFQDAYAIDVDNDNVLELVALFSGSDYGAIVVYECKNGVVSESYRRGGCYKGNEADGVFIDHMLYKNGDEYGFVEYEYWSDSKTGIEYMGTRLNKGYEGILVGVKEYENHSDWNEYTLYNQKTTEDVFNNHLEKIVSYMESGTCLFSAYSYSLKNREYFSGDCAKGANLEKYCIEDIVNDLQFYTSHGRADYIPDLITGALKVYQNGYYYEALELCNKILNISGITQLQRDDANAVINYCNERLFHDTAVAIERIRGMISKGQCYEALTEINNYKKGKCTQKQLNQLASMESTCKEKISAYEIKMEQYTTIYAKSGMTLTVQNKEVQGYLDSGVWFLTPQKTWYQMKQAAYQYIKNGFSNTLYYPNSAQYPGLDSVSFRLEEQDGSQAEYVLQFTMTPKNSYGYYVDSTFTCTLYCNPYGFYDYDCSEKVH